MGHLIEDIVVTQSSWAQTVTATTLYSAAIDMRDAQGILAIALGSSGTRPTTQKVWAMHLQGASDTGATFINIGSTNTCQGPLGQTKNTITNSILMLDTLHPNKNFVRVGVHDTSGLCARVAIIKYGLRKRGTSGVNADATKTAGYGTLINPTTV